MKKVLLTATVLTSLFFISCDSDDNGDSGTVINDPSTYTFERDGVSTVSFGGQSTRIAMAEELVSALKVETNTVADLGSMFAHVEGVEDFTDADLNASGKSIRSKVAASTDFYSANTTDAAAIKTAFDALIYAQVTEVFPSWTATASAGVAGGLQEAGGGSTRYINEKGLELNQAFAKSLIGALMVDQILNNYLSTAVLDAGDNIVNNDNDVADSDDSSYTTMEHKWDEAYGYLYGTEATPASPVLGADSFLNKYLGKVEADADFAGVAAAVFNAFKLGRAAIVAKDYTVRDAQAEIIKENISKVIAVRAVHYLQVGKELLATDKAAAFHDLSEGFGFVNSLQFTRKSNVNEPYFTKDQIEVYLAQLLVGNGFWDVSDATLDQISDDISAAFGFTTAQAAN